MQLARPFDLKDLRFEYGLDGVRLLPWPGASIPFGGAYCIVRPRSVSLHHVNSPEDEEELFVCISGKAQVVIGEESFEASQGNVFFIPRGVPHHVRNDTDTPFHFYALWWNKEIAEGYLEQRTTAEIVEPPL